MNINHSGVRIVLICYNHAWNITEGKLLQKSLKLQVKIPLGTKLRRSFNMKITLGQLYVEEVALQAMNLMIIAKI
jgi:hypothetical protein